MVRFSCLLPVVLAAVFAVSGSAHGAKKLRKHRTPLRRSLPASTPAVVETPPPASAQAVVDVETSEPRFIVWIEGPNIARLADSLSAALPEADIVTEGGKGEPSNLRESLARLRRDPATSVIYLQATRVAGTEAFQAVALEGERLRQHLFTNGDDARWLVAFLRWVLEEERPEPVRLPVIDVAVGGGTLSRWFAIRGPASELIPALRLPVAPLLHARVAFFPLALFPARLLSRSMLFADLSYALGLRTRDPDYGIESPTAFVAASSGLLLQLSPSSQRGGAGALSAFGIESYAITSGGQIVAGAPSTAYLYARFGISGFLRLGERVNLHVEAAYRWVLDAGYVASRFRHARVHGFDVALSLSVFLAKGFELRARASYQHYEYVLRSDEGDAYVASSARDQLLTPSLLLVWTL